MNRIRRITDILVNVWMRAGLYLLLAIPVLIGVGLYWKAAPIIGGHSLSDLLFSRQWFPMKGEFGFMPFIYSSAYVTVLAFILSAPLCLFAAIYLTQFGKHRLLQVMLPVIDILAGIPSVVYGVWGVLVIVPAVAKYVVPLFGVVSSGYSLLAGGVVLAVMCIPYMLNMLIEVFQIHPGRNERSIVVAGSNALGDGEACDHQERFPGNSLCIWSWDSQSFWRNHCRVDGGRQHPRYFSFTV